MSIDRRNFMAGIAAGASLPLLAKGVADVKPTRFKPIAGVSRLRKDDSGNLVVFGPSGLMIIFK